MVSEEKHFVSIYYEWYWRKFPDSLCLLQATFDGRGLQFHLNCAERFETAYRVWFGPTRSAVVLCHPETVKTVLQTTFKEKSVCALLSPFLGKDRFMAAVFKRKTSPSCSPIKFKSFLLDVCKNNFRKILKKQEYIFHEAKTKFLSWECIN